MDVSEHPLQEWHTKKTSMNSVKMSAIFSSTLLRNSLDTFVCENVSIFLKDAVVNLLALLPEFRAHEAVDENVG